MPPGAIDCWVFLTCLEVLHACEHFNESGQLETYSLNTASMWDYARGKVGWKKNLLFSKSFYCQFISAFVGEEIAFACLHQSIQLIHLLLAI